MNTSPPSLAPQWLSLKPTDDGHPRREDHGWGSSSTTRGSLEPKGLASDPLGGLGLPAQQYQQPVVFRAAGSSPSPHVTRTGSTGKALGGALGSAQRHRAPAQFDKNFPSLAADPSCVASAGTWGHKRAQPSNQYAAMAQTPMPPPVEATTASTSKVVHSDREAQRLKNLVPKTEQMHKSLVARQNHKGKTTKGGKTDTRTRQKCGANIHAAVAPRPTLTSPPAAPTRTTTPPATSKGGMQVMTLKKREPALSKTPRCIVPTASPTEFTDDTSLVDRTSCGTSDDVKAAQRTTPATHCTAGEFLSQQDERFLRELGWAPEGEEDDSDYSPLTAEEIASFKQEAQAPKRPSTMPCTKAAAESSCTDSDSDLSD